MSHNMTRCDVQDVLIGAGTPSALPPPWSDLGETELVDLPLSRTLLRRLGKEFDRETLRQAGVVESNGRGSIAFSPLLVKNPKIVSVTRTEPGGPAHDLLLGTAGTLSGRPAWAAALEDGDLKKLIADGQNQVFVVDTPEDFAVLRALGLAVIPAAGSDRLAGDEIGTLRGLLDVAPNSRPGMMGLMPHPPRMSRERSNTARKRSNPSDGGQSESGRGPVRTELDPDLPRRTRDSRDHRGLARCGRRSRRGSRAAGVAPRLYAPPAAAAAAVVRACQLLRDQARP